MHQLFIILLIVVIISSLLSGCRRMTDGSSSQQAPGNSVIIEDTPSGETAPYESSDYDGFFPQHKPIGTGVGAMPGRVAWVYEPDCVNWTEGLWWEFDNFDYDLIKQMVDEGITATGGGSTPAESWDAMFRYHNGTRGKGDVGYISGERSRYTIATKMASWELSKESGPEQMFAEQLSRCGVNYFDFYLLHSIQPMHLPNYNKYNCWDFCGRMKREGKIRHFGFPFHGDPALLDQVLIEHPEVDFVQLQILYEVQVF